MKSFSKLHPVVNLIYFAVMIVLMFVTKSDVLIGILFALGLVNYIFETEKKSKNYIIKFIAPMIFLITIFNPLFSHFGETILFYLPTGSAFTLESLLFGLRQGLVFSGVMLWFAFYNSAVSGDKFLLVFSRIMPNTALFLSMVFRFIPLFTDKAGDISMAQRGAGFAEEGKFQNSIKVFSSLITSCLETSVQTAEAMRARGFSNGKRKSYNRYKLKKTDILLSFAGILVFVSIVVSGKHFGIIQGAIVIIYGIIPIIIDVSRELRWKYLKSKI